MNSPDTIERRMKDAGLPYEITNMETPQFMLSGGMSVVALWQDSRDDTSRAFVGFYTDGAHAANVARATKRLRGVHTVYIVSPSEEF